MLFAESYSVSLLGVEGIFGLDAFRFLVYVTSSIGSLLRKNLNQINRDDLRGLFENYAAKKEND